MSLASPRLPRSIALLLLLVLSFLALPQFFDHSTSRYLPYARSYPATQDSEEPGELRLSLQDVVNAVAKSVQAAARRLDTDSLKWDWGIDLQGATLENYERDLRRTYEEFFAPSKEDASQNQISLLDQVLSKLSFLPSNFDSGQDPSDEIPKYIYTTDLLSPEELPDQFQSWIKENPEWKTMFVKDEEIDEWLTESFPSGQEGVLREIEGLPKDKGVVRADLFRYLVLLLNGGIYTDTDTACVRPIRDWAVNPDKPPPDPLLAALPNLLDLAIQLESGDGESAHIHRSAKDDGPSLVVAIETDAPASGADWRSETFIRGIQLVQWTIMANKGHPILLDVLGHALRTAKRVREGADSPSILDWTGPGVFTDAVFRYLLVRYGIHPRDISGITRPVRIGDIVIMPANSFRAEASEGWQGDDKVVWHGFFGRWKGEK